MPERWLVDSGFGERETTVETFCRNYPEARPKLDEIRRAVDEDGEYYLTTTFGDVAIYAA